MLSPKERHGQKRGLFYHCEILIYVLGDLGLNPIKDKQYSAAGDI